MNQFIGLPARGDNFYQRDREIARISDALVGSNIQLIAPRRVGKTSILWYLFDNRIAERHYVLIDTESISDASQFYKKVLEVILSDPKIKTSLSNKLKAGIRKTDNKFFHRIKSIKVLNTGIEFNHNESIRDYYEEFRNFLIDYCAVEDTPLVLLIDEFPQTIENINKKNTDEAILFLLGKRALRIDYVISQKVRFIYTGSIGLNQVVSAIGATATINDLNPIEVEPLTEDETIDFLKKSLQGKDIHQSAVDVLRKLLQWYIPFHIQLIALEIQRTNGDAPLITGEIIEDAIEGLLSLRYKSHFDHYYVRLKSHFKGDAFRYADLLLKQLAEKQVLSTKEALELAISCQQEEGYRLIIENLMHDGYIHCDYKQHIYFFNSPILKRWWERFICKL
ncbi:ATP-binding protein [Chitinophaga sp. S165]|uniref:ATP-binding protein n=1 Tax=Chitinophaga sp. S165 TaxID=2135462 RepID=UPI000D70AB71|nr:ATP-binding protein [Chitinophaga sp. S165]PWV56979.1 AAA ATPase-like protein [Chitinophaga sp. S165]